MKITRLSAHPILNARGNPTVHVVCELQNGIITSASVPTNIPRGPYEAFSIHDSGDGYEALGVSGACSHVPYLLDALADIDVEKQREIDLALIAFDNSKDKSRIGANTMLGVSIAVLKAGAQVAKKELYEYINDLSQAYFQRKLEIGYPIPLFSMIVRGHREFFIIPSSYKDAISLASKYQTQKIDATKVKEWIYMGGKIHYTIGEILRVSGVSDMDDPQNILNLLCEACEKSGYRLYDDIVLGIDASGRSCYQAKKQVYSIHTDTTQPSELSSQQLDEYYQFFLKHYPLVYIEDPFIPEDKESFARLQSQTDAIVCGDDLVATNEERLHLICKGKTVRAISISPGHVGTVYETLACINLCIENNLLYIPSHVSDETSDSLLVDLAMGTGAPLLKAGMFSGEGAEKYNRLLEIANTQQ